MNSERRISFLRKQLEGWKMENQSLMEKLESLRHENQALRKAESDRDRLIEKMTKDAEARKAEHERVIAELRKQKEKYMAARNDMIATKKDYRNRMQRLFDKAKNKT